MAVITVEIYDTILAKTPKGSRVLVRPTNGGYLWLMTNEYRRVHDPIYGADLVLQKIGKAAAIKPSFGHILAYLKAGWFKHAAKLFLCRYFG